MYYRLSLIFLWLFLSAFTPEWNKEKHHTPLNIKSSISGTYGELRTGRFHSGLDFRTQGTIGHDVFSIDDAYVSRIRVLSASYGKVLYLTHPEGYVSVYAHLNSFDPEIEAYVKEQQYDKKTFEIDLFPPAHLFHFKKGDRIGISGNSGYSYGPHLHFEIRDKNHVPLNPMRYHFGIRDDLPPQIHHVGVYPMDKESLVNQKNKKAIYQVNGKDGKYSIDDTIYLSGPIGFGIEVYDYLNDSRNRCGVYRIELFVDGKKIYAHTIDAIPFHVTRFLNAILDYDEWVRNRRKIQKSFVRGYNKLPIYDHLTNQGIFSFEENKTYELQYFVYDYHGNKSKLSCILQYSDENIEREENAEKKYLSEFEYQKENYYEDTLITIKTPAYAFYNDFFFDYMINENHEDYWSPVILLGDPGVPLHKGISFEIKSPDVRQHSHAEYFTIAGINDKEELSGVGGELTEQGVLAVIRNFGRYTLVLDTIPPTIAPVNIPEDKNMENEKSIQFTIKDALSGIADYTGYINNEWVLFEYDLKNDLLLYHFDEERITRGEYHSLELYITDGMDNMATYYTRFYY